LEAVIPASLASILCCDGEPGLDEDGELLAAVLMPLVDIEGTFNLGLTTYDLF